MDKEFIRDFIYKLSYDEMLYKDNFPEISKDDEEKIKLIILNGEYDKLLKPLVYKLYRHTDISNMLYCCLNLDDVKLIKRKLTSKDPKERMLFRLIDASYDKIDNLISYKHKKDISHELLHLASTRPSLKNKGKRSGFLHVENETKHLEGINEGYTELLNRRIFFDEKYNTYSYRKKVFFMRLVELLYEDSKEMESDYFKANYKSLKDHFLTYSTPEEFNEFVQTIDKFDFLVEDNETNKTFELLETIVKRTKDKEKILLSRQYIDEYYRIRH